MVLQKWDYKTNPSKYCLRSNFNSQCSSIKETWKCPTPKRLPFKWDNLSSTLQCHNNVKAVSYRSSIRDNSNSLLLGSNTSNDSLCKTCRKILPCHIGSPQLHQQLLLQRNLLQISACRQKRCNSRKTSVHRHSSSRLHQLLNQKSCTKRNIWLLGWTKTSKTNSKWRKPHLTDSSPSHRMIKIWLACLNCSVSIILLGRNLRVSRVLNFL